MMIGLVQPGTSRGTLLMTIGSRKMVPPRMLRTVPLGEAHIFLRPNSLTRASSGVIVAHLAPAPYFLMAFAALLTSTGIHTLRPKGHSIVSTSPIKVAVTGAAGQIGYSLLFHIASGALFGPEVPVELRLLEITPALKTLEGVVMELDDCAFPTLAGVQIGDDPNTMFEGVN